MNRILVLGLVAAALGTTACKKKQRYSPTCQRAVALTAPWSDLGLPTSDGRVCASDADRAELQFLSGDQAGWEQRFADALVAAGFAKSKCSSQSCTFTRDAERATVQVIGTKRWITVVVRR